jgi:hypothetical protein
MRAVPRWCAAECNVIARGAWHGMITPWGADVGVETCAGQMLVIFVVPQVIAVWLLDRHLEHLWG